MRSIPKHRKVLGENIRLHRNQAELSQEKLAEKAEFQARLEFLQVRVGYISNHPYPSVEVAQVACDAINGEYVPLWPDDTFLHFANMEVIQQWYGIP